jgi:hypothetical protein
LIIFHNCCAMWYRWFCGGSYSSSGRISIRNGRTTSFDLILWVNHQQKESRKVARRSKGLDMITCR